MHIQGPACGRYVFDAPSIRRSHADFKKTLSSLDVLFSAAPQSIHPRPGILNYLRLQFPRNTSTQHPPLSPSSSSIALTSSSSCSYFNSALLVVHGIPLAHPQLATNVMVPPFLCFCDTVRFGACVQDQTDNFASKAHLQLDSAVHPCAPHPHSPPTSTEPTPLRFSSAVYSFSCRVSSDHLLVGVAPALLSFRLFHTNTHPSSHALPPHPASPTSTSPQSIHQHRRILKCLPLPLVVDLIPLGHPQLPSVIMAHLACMLL